MRKKRAILLVEDDPDISSSIVEALEFENVQVTCAFNGREGIERLMQGERPSLILLDLMMPETDGVWFCQERKKHGDLMDIPVVIMSADGQIKVKASGLDVNGILKKPVGMDDLFQMVGKYIPSNS